MSRWRLVLVPVLALVVGIMLAWALGGLRVALAVPVLALLEVSLSFDNAVMNATVLRRMSRGWQQLFMTIGLLIAVVGVRLVFPVVIVAITSGLSLGHVTALALHQPLMYAARLALARPEIVAFGAVFLLMVFLDFVLDASKHVHWLVAIERPLGRAGRLRPLSALVALIALALTVEAWPGAAPMRPELTAAGLCGLAVYLAVRFLKWRLEIWQDLETPSGKGVRQPAVGRAALALFVYLELLDATFSFDGVVGAFAVTTNVLVIAIGLGIGALVVRELTVLLVHRDAFSKLIFLEHGAHYAVGAVAVLLGLSLICDLPAAVTGIVSSAIISLAVVSSLRHRKLAGG